MNLLSIPTPDVHALPHEIRKNTYEVEQQLLIQQGRNPREADHHLQYFVENPTGKYDGYEPEVHQGTTYDVARGLEPMQQQQELQRLLMIKQLSGNGLGIPTI